MVILGFSISEAFLGFMKGISVKLLGWVDSLHGWCSQDGGPVE